MTCVRRVGRLSNSKFQIEKKNTALRNLFFLRSKVSVFVLRFSRRIILAKLLSSFWTSRPKARTDSANSISSNHQSVLTAALELYFWLFLQDMTNVSPSHFVKSTCKVLLRPYPVDCASSGSSFFLSFFSSTTFTKRARTCGSLPSATVTCSIAAKLMLNCCNSKQPTKLHLKPSFLSTWFNLVY